MKKRMNKGVKIFFTVLLLAGVTLIISSVAAQQGPPSFEIAPSAGPELGLCSDATCTNSADCEGSGSGQCNASWTATVTVSPSNVMQDENVRISMNVTDVSGVETVLAHVKNPNSTRVASVTLYDDGEHGDQSAGDGFFSNEWNVGSNSDGLYRIDALMTDRLGNPTLASNIGTFALGEGICSSNADCTVSEECCYGICGVNECTAAGPPCNDGDISTADSCNTESCPNACEFTLITDCDDGSDGYCPTGCTNPPDSNCTDSTPPSPTVWIDPLVGDEITTDTYDAIFRAEDAESGISEVLFYLDTEPNYRDRQITPGADGYYHWLINVASVPNGGHSIRAQARNGAGMIYSSSIHITINRSIPNNQPTVVITNPSTGSLVAGDVPVAINATDDVSVGEIRLYHCSDGFINSVIGLSGPAVSTTINWDTSIYHAYNEGNVVSKYVEAPRNEKDGLWFIPVAHADEDECTTTTTTSNVNECIYAESIDDQNAASNQHIIIPYRQVTTTTTTCIPPASGGSA